MQIEHLTVEVRGSDLYRRGVIPHRELSLSLAIRYCAVGEWELSLPASSHMARELAKPGAGIIVSYRGEVIFSGPMDFTELKADNDDDWIRTFSGPCDNVILEDMLLWPNPLRQLSSQDGKATHDISGKPYQVIADYVTANSSNWTGEGGRVRTVDKGGLYVKYSQYITSVINGYGSQPPQAGVYPGSTQTVSYSARFTPAIEMAQAMEKAGSGPFEVRYEIVPIDTNGTMAPRSVLRPQRFIDPQGAVRFDIRTMNGVESSGSKMGAPTMTSCIVGGVGQLQYRTFEGRTVSTPDVTQWCRFIERFEDDRNTASRTKLGEYADEQLRETAKTQIEQSLELSEDMQYEYGVDFTLGSPVRVIELDGIERESRVEGVVIKADNEGLRCGVQIGKVEDKRSRFEARVSALERQEFAPPSTWTDISPKNGWEVYPWRQTRWRVSSGEVQMDGSIRNGAVGTTAFTLPEGSRPTQNKQIICPSGTGFARVTVEAGNGNVNVDYYGAGGDNSFVSMEPVRFYLT